MTQEGHGFDLESCLLYGNHLGSNSLCTSFEARLIHFATNEYEALE